jgi:hypothetical protein
VVRGLTAQMVRVRFAGPPLTRIASQFDLSPQARGEV